MTELVLAVLLPSVTSLAVMVCEPVLPKVTLKICVPEARAAFAGKVAAESLEVIPTRSVTVVTRFQFASTALTVTLRAAPIFSAKGVPVLPVAVPGAAVSPGTSNCNFVNPPTFTVTEGLVLAGIAECVVSEAVIVALPAVLSVTLKLLLPPTSAALAGSAALASLELIATVSLVFTIFQFASTALTVTVKAVPAVGAVGVPVLPFGVPGAAVSPGNRICSLANTAALTVMAELVFAVLVISVTSLAVTVGLPIVFSVTLKLFVPLTSEEFPGKVALLSEELMLTMSATPLTRFQFASTAFIITLKAVPAFSVLGVPVLPEV